VPEYAVAKAAALEAEGKDSFRRAVRAGVRHVCGTDAGTPFNPHGNAPHELVYMVQWGMTPLKAMPAATANGAELLRLPLVGTIEEGKEADLVLFDGNPAEAIEHVVSPLMVLKAGRVAALLQQGEERRMQLLVIGGRARSRAIEDASDGPWSDGVPPGLRSRKPEVGNTCTATGRRPRWLLGSGGMGDRPCGKTAWCATRRNLVDAVANYLPHNDGLPTTPRGHRGTPTQPPFLDTEEITDESYGPLKVGWSARRSTPWPVPGRPPGYIVGPHDPSDRFTYWVRRGAAGGRMLAPGPQDHALQVVDVRDLGAFTLDHVEAGTADIFGVVGPREPLTWGEAVPALVTAADAETELTWVDAPFLRERINDEEGELPLWDIEYPGLHAFDASKAIAAGLLTARSRRRSRTRLRGSRSRPRSRPQPERERALLQA
jgi:hypothetical protein